MSAEEIRLKRLARVGGLGAENSNSSHNNQNTSQTAPNSTQIASKPSQIVSKSPQIITKSPQVSSKYPSVSQSNKLEQITYSQYEQPAIERLLRITIRNSEGCTQLNSLKEELGNAPLSLQYLDSAIFTYLTTQTHVFSYLMDCWIRARKELSIINKEHISLEKTKKTHLITTIQEMTISYALLSITVPDMYEANSQHMIDVSETQWDFVATIFNRAVEDDDMVHVASSLIKKINANLIDNPQGYTKYLHFAAQLFNITSFAHAVTQIDGFVESGINTESVAQIEKNTLGIGPLFSISPLNHSIAINIYPQGTLESQLDPRASPAGIVRAELKIIQDHLFSIADKIVRSSDTARLALLSYFGNVLNSNHRRRATRLQENMTSSDAFLLNISAVLLRLADPFSRDFTKIDKIDIFYFEKQKIMDISNETRLNVDSLASAAYYDRHSNNSYAPPNFVSHIFFLTAGFLHYGFCGSQQQISRLKEVIDQRRAYLDQLHSMLDRSNTTLQPVLSGLISMVEKSLWGTIALRAVIMAAVCDNDFLSMVLQFVLFQMEWLVRVIDPTHQHPLKRIILPLENPQNEPFAYFPEFLVEGPVDIVNRICRGPTILIMLSPILHIQSLVTFGVTFLFHSTLIKNPHLKSRIVEMLFCGTSPIYSQNDGFLVNIFNSDSLALKSLMYSLMNIYIEFEQTGAHTQFYDKFNIRYYVSQIIESIWHNTHYQQRLERESKKNVDFFVRFVALLLNDVTYLMDESLSKLIEIRTCEAELEALDPNDTQKAAELQSRFNEAERTVKGYMPLTNKNMKLLDLFTQAVPKAFVSFEIVDRLAAMMNHNLKALVGPKCRNLKVKNSVKYGFDPKDLLSKLVRAYFNLRNEPSFITAVARDGRSFDPANFTRALELFARFNFTSIEFNNQIADFRDKAAAIALHDEEEEQDLGEIPEEYLDPLMFTLMKNPVILPASKVSIDLATIKSHLLSDPKDPFNRAPLTLDEVKPNDALRMEIEAWVAERHAAKSKRMSDVGK